MISKLNSNNILNIDSNDIKFLKELSSELNTQDYGVQAQPAFWGIGDYEWIQASEGCGDRQTIYAFDIDEDHSLSHLEMAKALVEMYQDNDVNDLVADNDKQKIYVQLMNNMQESIERDMYRYDDIISALFFLQIDYSEHDETKNHYVVPNTLFLTKREVENHLQENKHHYTSEAHPYLMTAWRSPEFEKLLGILRRI